MINLKKDNKGFDVYNINTLVYKRAKDYIKCKRDTIVRNKAAKLIWYNRRARSNVHYNRNQVIRQAYCAAYLSYTLELGILDNMKNV